MSSDIGADSSIADDDISLSEVQLLSNDRILLSYWKISVSRRGNISWQKSYDIIKFIELHINIII